MPEDEAVRCPGCGHNMVRVVNEGVRFQCDCGGHMLGVIPLEHLLEDGLGAHLYVASRDGESGVTCPFCRQPMRHTTTSGGGVPTDLAFCHVCEQVWVPPDAADWLAAQQGGTAAPAAPAEPAECQECGAPWEPDSMGRCPYCHAQLTAPDPLIVEP